ncbi:unnamed protein product [Caenorhabditis bovis]|uniref:non-specific serine/threonine protein kinase n=1 Tax=Caenorhabditis bovis TaxID=2654633 RepID=A0A8S1EUB7_9PELO|nr:unnamed protein product [Caenorhabditis bovis]
MMPSQMPPKKTLKKKNLHELSTEVKPGFQITDTKKNVFIVGKQFATGGFGRIHTCTQKGESKELVIKIEPSENGPLFTEINVFQRILKPEQIEEFKKKKNLKFLGVPHVISNGIFQYGDERMRYLVIPKYATSLESVREQLGGQLGVQSALQVAASMLRSLEYVHAMDYTHADVKAANILLERVGDFETTVLVDFGLGRFAANNEDKPDKKRAHNGTCIFTSIDAHKGYHPSFRGDIEILAYNMILWITGSLPWISLESSPDKVSKEKEKFVDGLPASLNNIVKNSTAAKCIGALFDAARKTKYTSKVDFGKLLPIIEKASTTEIEVEKATGSRRTTKSTRRAAKEPEVVERSTRRTPKKSKMEPSSSSENSDDIDEDEAPSKKAPTSRIGNTSTTQTLRSAKDTMAKKIVKKYKKKSIGASSPIKVPSAALRTTAPSRSGITTAVKASPTKLRKVPGMRNFPSGRRSLLINNTSKKYAGSDPASTSGKV